LKSDDKLKRIPVILFTAGSGDPLKVVKESRADDYMTKPFEPEVLIKKIKKLIK